MAAAAGCRGALISMISEFWTALDEATRVRRKGTGDEPPGNQRNQVVGRPLMAFWAAAWYDAGTWVVRSEHADS